jgi:hypothetical protein
MEAKVIREKVPHLSARRAKQIVQFATMIRKGAETVSMSSFSTRRCIQWAHKLAYYRNPIESAESVFLNKVSPEDADVLRKSIKLIFGGKKRKDA